MNDGLEPETVDVILENRKLTAELADLRQQLAEARATIEAKTDTIDAAEETINAQAAELATLREQLKTRETQQDERIAFLEREVSAARTILDSCRDNDNHWGDVEVENHRLKADNATLRERLAAAEGLVRRFYNYHTSSWSTEFAMANFMMMLLADVEAWIPPSTKGEG